jgi:UrcA family protein
MTMSISIQNSIRVAAFMLSGAFVACALQASANAAEQPMPSQKVSYADLDISKPAGAVVLYRRIVKAAHQVCEDNTLKGMSTYRLINHCVDRAISRAVNDVGSPALSALLPHKPFKVASN